MNTMISLLNKNDTLSQQWYTQSAKTENVYIMTDIIVMSLFHDVNGFQYVGIFRGIR